MQRIILIGILLATISLSLNAQNEIHFSHLGMEDGFTNSRANTIIQDKKGFIWVGTWNGLNRYDGYNCTSYQPNFHDSTSISNREIVELMEDSGGSIWIGTSNGLNCLNPATGKLKNYEFRNRILSLCEGPDSSIWIGTWNGGLFNLNPQTGETKHYLANDIVSDICIDSRNILWAATYYGLMKFDQEKGYFIRYLPQKNENSIANSTITQIIESADGKLWVGTWGGGLDKVDVSDHGNQLHFTHYKRENAKGSLNANVIAKLCYDKFHNLWIGSWNEGLRLLKEDQQLLPPEQAQFISYREEPDNPASLSSDGVSSLYVDRSGILWVGGASIDRTSIVESGIKRYRLPKDINDPYKKTVIKTFAEYKNQLWIGVNAEVLQYELSGGIYQFRKRYERPDYLIGETRYTANSILDIAADSSGLWIGTEDAGLIHYNYSADLLLDTRTQRFLNQQTTPAIPGNKVCCITLSKKYPGVLWLGTLQSGFARLTHKPDNTTETEIYVSGNSDKSCSDNNIRSIFEDRSGKIWVGTQNGLNCYNPLNKHFDHYCYSPSDKNSINDNVINTISEDRSGNLWVGTNAGLNKKVFVSNGAGEPEVQFQGYPRFRSLSNEIVTNLLEDESGNLWVRQYRGFIKFNIEKEIPVAEYFSKDYENIRFERNTALKFSDGQFILGDQAGFMTFYPDSLFKKSVPPKVVITDFMVFNESLNNRTKANTKNKLKTSIPYANRLTLSYKDKMLSIIFSAMDYKNPNKNSFFYKLVGFDDQWNDVGSSNSATYTNLPNGKYTFRVKAQNSDGVWSEKEASLIITILPPWWKTIWAYLIYSILGIGLLYFFNKYSFIKAQEKSNLTFEKMKTEEIARLNELKSFFFTDITHELKTPLTLILGPARELSSDKSLNPYAYKQAELIKNSAYKLLRLVNQLMEFRKIEKGIMDELFIQQVDINQLLLEVVSFFKPMAESRKIDFSLSTGNQEPLIAYADPDKLEKVIFNLVSNAFKYSKDSGTISIYAKMKTNEMGKQEIRIEVKDNGIGIEEHHKQRIFERFFQVNQIRTQSTGGIGLYMAKALVEQHGGYIELTSEIGKGSCFRISIPVNPEGLKNKPAEQNETRDDRLDEPIEKQEQEIIEQNGKHDKKYKPLILVVEDDGDLNDFLVTGLTREFKVISAFNGKEALEKAKTQNPDLILTDIMMPEMDGFEFCRITRKDINTSHIPVVFLTAKTMQQDEIKGLKMGAVDYIYKPFNLVSLKLKINNILSSQKQMHEHFRTEQLLQPETIELSSLDEIFLKEAVESVQKNLDDPTFDVEAFSNQLNVSPNQLYRKIKALTGQTAKEFIRNQRLKIAANMLLQRKRSISEVIYMVGFTSPSYFTRCFKEFYGATPKEYIDRNTGA